jgi:hypothetical protein
MDQNNQQLIKASVVTVIIAGALGTVTVFAGSIGAGSAKIFALSFSLILFGITATTCMVVTRKPELKMAGNAGMAVSALGFLLTLIIVIAEIVDQVVLKLALVSLILAIGLAHICLLHHFTLQNKYALYARITATIAISVFTFCLILQVFGPIPGWYSLLYNQSTLKLLVAAFIIDLAATLLVPLCNRLRVDEPVELELTPDPPAPEEPQTPAP